MAMSLTTLSSVLSGLTYGESRPFFHHRRSLRFLSYPTSGLSLHISSRTRKSNSGISFSRNPSLRLSNGVIKVEDGIDDEACELVNGFELSIGEGDDSVRAYLFKAVKNNNGTGLLLLSDIFGSEDSSNRDFAYRVACNGYNVLVPDLFRGDPWSKDRPRTMFDQWIAKHDPKRIMEDISTCTKWMMDEFTAAGISKKLGVIGFCFGGGRVIDVLAKDRNACFGIGVSFYATRVDSALASDIKVPVLFISGDNDRLCEVDVLFEMEKSIGKGSKVVVFKDRGHGFAHRPESPEEDRDAEEAFSIMRNWLHDSLVVKN